MNRESIALTADPNDSEDFHASPEALDRAWKSRLIRRTRIDLGLSQKEFSRRFQVPLGTLRDWEQTRSTPPEFAVAYVRVIARCADIVAEEASTLKLRCS